MSQSDGKILYEPRWKEMLDGYIGSKRFTVEMTMGVEHVYFPTEETWNESAPEWARGQWRSARDQAETWAIQKKIPFDVDFAAWVDFQPESK